MSSLLSLDRPGLKGNEAQLNSSPLSLGPLHSAQNLIPGRGLEVTRPPPHAEPSPNPPEGQIGEGEEEEEEDGAGGDLLRDDLRRVPLLGVHGQGPRLDRPPPGREGNLIAGLYFPPFSH